MLRQLLHPRYPPRPQALGRGAEGISSLRRNNPNGLQNRFPRVAAENSRVIDPFQGRLEFGIQGIQGDGVDP